jgi:hypothetical protein
MSPPAVLAGGNVRVGLEDNLWLDKGVLATNAQLVEKRRDDHRKPRRAGDRAGRGAQEAWPDKTRARDDHGVGGRHGYHKKAAAIGGGVIGGGWIARLALNGIDVAVFDPHPEAKRKVDEVMANARRAYKRMATRACRKKARSPMPSRLRKPCAMPTDPGKRAGAARPQAEDAGRDRAARARRRADRLVDVGLQGDRHGEDMKHARALPSSRIRSTRSICCRSSRSCPATKPARKYVEWAKAFLHLDRHEAVVIKRRSMRLSATACSKPPGARRCG